MFVLKLKDKEINLKWGTWAMHRACVLAGNLTVDQFFTQLLQGSIGFDKVCVFLRAGVEFANKGECPYTDFDFSEWIDECGGMFQSVSPINDYFNYIVSVTTSHITPLPNEKPSKKKPKS